MSSEIPHGSRCRRCGFLPGSRERSEEENLNEMLLCVSHRVSAKEHAERTRELRQLAETLASWSILFQTAAQECRCSR